jgi:hypothetical protein
MAERKWNARTKRDLMIEVWEALDCESVGRKELEEVAKAVQERFGEGAVDMPCVIARVLADEGAELRHVEVLDLDVKKREFDRYEPMFRNVLKFADFRQAIASIKTLDNLRRKFMKSGDKVGLRLVRETAEKGRRRALMIAKNAAVDEKKRDEKAEIAEWFSVWLRQPEIFPDWVELRQSSKEFQARFGSEPAEPELRSNVR